jgi:serine/threonine protein kinase
MHPSDPSADEATEFQGTPAATDAGSALPTGAVIGAYVIRHVLGEGGMGRVYLAEQTRPVRREVALKLIREQVASPLARAYFDVERQALAQMRHPAIAQVFDAGTDEHGHPYLAMEVVEGRSITEFCRKENLGRDRRLALFARVCHGVQHAHQKGIIHRDLKPANVLVSRVDGEPSPKIIDFGIAIGGAGGVNAAGAVTDRAGTAIYMSPEQADHRHRDLDTRSDVYSLGVMLYEVLTGDDAIALTSMAHRSKRAVHKTLLAAIDSYAQRISAVPDAAALTAAAHGLPTELRAVLRKALATDRDQRYDSAAALADDLERFHDKRPIKALPQTRRYIARTFVARHRLGFATACMIAIALVTGIALALNGLARARKSAALAQTEAAKADQVSKFVRDMLGGIDPDRAKTMDRKLMRMVLDSAADRASRELKGQPAVRAQIESTIGDSYMGIGEYVLAQQHFAAAEQAARSANLGVVEESRIMLRTAEAMANQGRIAEALAQGQRALGLLAAYPADDRDRLYAQSHVGSLECEANKSEDCRKHCSAALEGERRVLGKNDPETLATLGCLAYADTNLARFDEARPLYQSLIHGYRSSYGEDNSHTLNAINGLAIVDLEQKRFADAEKLLAPALPIYERVFGPDHPKTLIAVMNLGGAIRQQGRNEEARPYYERALAMSLKQFGADSSRTVMAESNLGALERDAGQLSQADVHARNAVAHCAKALGADNPYCGIILDGMATILTREKRYAEAEKDLDRAYAMLSKGMGPDHPRTQDVIDHYVDLYTAWAKPAAAAQWRAKKTASVVADAKSG